MTRAKTGTRFAAIAVAATLLLTGCIPGFRDDAKTDSRLYTGPIPAPAALPPSPELPPQPVMPGDTTDQAAMDAYLSASEAYSQAVQANQPELIAHYDAMRALGATTRAGGEHAVAVWQSLLVTAGIAVAGPDGQPIEIDGKTGFGWALTDAELRLHSVLATAPGGLRLVDLADALAAVPGISAPALAEAIHQDLTRIEDTDFSKVLTSTQTELLYANHQAKAIDEVVLNWSSVGLVLRRLSAELAVSDAGAIDRNDTATGPTPAPTIALASFPGTVKASSSKRACNITIDNPWAAELVNQFNKAHATFVFDMAIGRLDEAAAATGKSGVGGKIGLARLISAFYTMLAKAAALDATFSIDNAPLVRTKNTQPGEVRDLTVTFEFAEDSWEDIRSCMNLFLAPLGLDVPGSKAGAAESIDVQLYSEQTSVLRIGDGKGDNADVTQARTDSGGSAKFRVSGAPQADILPEVAEPEDVEVALRAVTNLGGNDFFKDMASLPWDALDAASTGGLTAIPQVLSRMKLITQTGTVPVRDWNLEADFEATLVASIESRAASNHQTPGGCGHAARVITSSTHLTASMASDTVPISAVLLSNPDGNLGDQAAVFVATGQEFQPYDFGQGPVMFEMLGNYSAEKTHHEPAVGELPPLKVGVSNGVCADGGTGVYVPPVPDCGQRTYTDALQVAVPAPKTLHAGSKLGYLSESLWEECGHGLDPVAPQTTSCDAPKRTGGKFPSIADVFDSSTTMIEISGSLTCLDVSEGWMDEFDYQWTLVLCRIVDGKAAC
ncbi:MAG: hypothetical protein WED09_06880 [Homoserinimonas sp.]